MKLLSLVTLTAMLSLTACSHHKSAKAGTCTEVNCSKPCCDKEKKCADGSCVKEEKKDCCSGDSCKKKS